MILSITKDERQQRLDKVREVIARTGYRAMLFVADSYLGKKGSLRYLFDNHLIHRYGYGVVLPEGQYQVLPSGLRWCTERKVPDTVFPEDHEVMEVVRILMKNGVTTGTLGVVGLNNTLKLEDYNYIKQELPELELVDATIEFDRVRSIKSDSEIEGIREANRIIEVGFQEIIKNIKVGMTEEEITAHAYKAVHELGAKDTLFLTHSSENPGEVEPYQLNPRSRVMKHGNYLVVSLEITGPSGHWIEYSRMFCFGERNEEMERIASAVEEGILYAEKTLKPGVKVTDVQKEIERIAFRNGYGCGHLTGHGIGQDVIERPLIASQTKTNFIGVEVPTERDEDLLYLKEGMVISFHPQMVDPNLVHSAYMSDLFVITADGCERLSKTNHEVILVK